MRSGKQLTRVVLPRGHILQPAQGQVGGLVIVVAELVEAAVLGRTAGRRSRFERRDKGQSRRLAASFASSIFTCPSESRYSGDCHLAGVVIQVVELRQTHRARGCPLPGCSFAQGLGRKGSRCPAGVSRPM